MRHKSTARVSSDSSLDSLSSDSVSSVPALRHSLLPTPNFSELNPLINAVRFLSADTVLNAGSGHTGMPMGMAPATTLLWYSHLNFSPNSPNFINRDRFILSAGHGSSLLYSLLHIFNVRDAVSLADLKSFRTHPGPTAGHPENILTTGVEVTTGALGQGIANAVGFALAESHLRATYGKPNFSPIDHYIFCVVGDGCLMEGISAEVCSLAGHWKLSHLIVLYDDNSISIEGSTDLAFTEDVTARFRAINWQVLTVEDGNTDLYALDKSIRLAKAETEKPSLIRIKTTIGHGMPSLAGTAEVHGPCLDADEINGARKNLNWEHPPFHIPESVRNIAHSKTVSGFDLESRWEENFSKYCIKYPEISKKFKALVIRKELPSALNLALKSISSELTSEPQPTRTLSGKVLNAVASVLPSLIGGSADLSPSTNTTLTMYGDYQHDSATGRNIHFGVREHGMGSICNGLALHGTGLIPFCSTFLVFSDYMRASIRTAALSKAQVLFILTHDSIFIGQDGPTHQPIEHLASLRAMPNVLTFRPAGAAEVAAAYELAISRKEGPSVLALSRQSFSAPYGSRDGALRGGYTLVQEEKGAPLDGVIIATGSEVEIATESAIILQDRGLVVRVVSMPCMEVFLQQGKQYITDVLGDVGRARRLVVEAGSEFGWHRFADHIMSVNTFGLSAPLQKVADFFKFTVPNVVHRFDEMMSCAESPIF